MLNEFFSPLMNLFAREQSVAGLVSNIVQLSIIFAVLYAIYKKFIQGTSSEKLVKGILILILCWLFGEFLIKINIQIIGTFIRASISIVALSLIIIFQPELRRFLSYIGQTNFWKKVFLLNNEEEMSEKTDTMQELVETVKYLSKTKTGGLIVIQNDEDTTLYSEIGTKIDAKITTELLLTIFYPSTPLHDGAVIINNKKIVSAGVLLPLTEDPKLSWRYGTRHRAAIGVTEVNDCACIVVSEETGDISVAVDGVLKKYESIMDFKTDLSSILNIDVEEKKEKLPQKVLDFINFRPGAKSGKN